jgi:hypothetical protein
VALLIGAVLLAGCAGCDVDDVFTRQAPEVKEAIVALDAGDAGAAVGLLEQYLQTGSCEQGQIGTPEGVRTRPNAGFDLGLGLFELGEQFGARFGDEELDDGGAAEAKGPRSEQVECALRIVRLIAADTALPIDLRARAHYLAGNLEFLRRDYRSAVKAYELALKLIPGLPGDAGDSIGRDAAWNRAIALRRIEDEQQDAGPDAPPDAPPDAQPEGGDGGEGGPPDAGGDGGNTPDAGNQGGNDSGADDGSSPPNDRPDAGAPPEQQPPEPQSSPSVNQDERILDMLERAPTLQQHDAKSRALKRGVSGMEDK